MKKKNLRYRISNKSNKVKNFPKLLSEIIDLLRESNLEKGFVFELLKLIGNGIGALDVFLVQRIANEKKKQKLKCLGYWSQQVENNSQKMQNLMLFCSKIMEAMSDGCDYIQKENNFKVKSKNYYHNLNLYYLMTGNNIFGFLGIVGIKKNNRSNTGTFDLPILSRILELWLDRLNWQKMFNNLTSTVPDPLQITDLNGIIRAWNPAMEIMTGVKAVKIIGKGNYEHAIPFYGKRRPTVANLIVCPDHKWESIYVEFRREKSTISSLGYCPNLPGGAAFVSGNTYVINDLNERPFGSIHYLRDVTREREIERELNESKSQYEILMDHAQIGIMRITKKGIEYVNNKLREFMETNSRNITLSKFLAWISTRDRNTIREQINQILKGPIQYSRSEFQTGNNHSKKYYLYSAHTTESEGKRMIHFFLEDVTVQKEWEERLRQHRIRMNHEERLAALGTMATGIAHELNQPLNTVRVITDGILYGKEKKWKLSMSDLYNKLSVISRQVVRMSDVIQNIREFGRGDQSTIIEDVNVNEAIKNILSMTSVQFREHGIDCSLKLFSDLPKIQSRRGGIDQVITNLIVNARQAFDTSRKIRKRIQIRSQLDDDIIRIEVSDNAIGITPADINKIFDPFFTTKHAGQGTGLGLSISKSIISEMKGSIEACNNREGGATFIIRIPVSNKVP